MLQAAKSCSIPMFCLLHLAVAVDAATGGNMRKSQKLFLF